jgi:hypothetical protein
MGRLLGELLRASRVQALHTCRRVCAIPSTMKRKAELVDELLLQAQDEQKHQAIFTRLLDGMTTEALRQWISTLSMLSFEVPPSSVMQGPRADIVHAIVQLDRPIRMPAGGEELALVALDSSAAPARTEQKLKKRWHKLARKAIAAALRKSLPRRLRQAVAKLLEDHPDHTVAALREAAGRQVGVSLEGKYRYLFDKALYRLTAMPMKKRRPQVRWVLATARQRSNATTEGAG